MPDPETLEYLDGRIRVSPNLCNGRPTVGWADGGLASLGKQSGITSLEVKPDLLLIYREPDDKTLQLVRPGSHSALGL